MKEQSDLSSKLNLSENDVQYEAHDVTRLLRRLQTSVSLWPLKM